MISKIERKLLFELNYDFRVKRKELGISLKKSQPQVHYLTEKLGDVFIPKTIIDPAKFQLSTLLVLFVFTKFDKTLQKVFIKELESLDAVNSISRTTGGVDLIVEFSVLNLSSFNKIQTEILDKHSDLVKVLGVFPIIVRHEFSSSFLDKRLKKNWHHVIGGDRDPANLNQMSWNLLKILIENPKISIAKLSDMLSLDPRTVIKNFKALIKQKIILGFSVEIKIKKIGLQSQYVFVRLHENKQETISSLVELSKDIPEVVKIYKLIGEYDLMFLIEGESLSSVLDDIRDKIKFFDYAWYDLVEKIKSCYIPKEDVFGTQ